MGAVDTYILWRVTKTQHIIKEPGLSNYYLQSKTSSLFIAMLVNVVLFNWIFWNWSDLQTWSDYNQKVAERSMWLFLTASSNVPSALVIWDGSSFRTVEQWTVYFSGLDRFLSICPHGRVCHLYFRSRELQANLDPMPRSWVVYVSHCILSTVWWQLYVIAVSSNYLGPCDSESYEATSEPNIHLKLFEQKYY